LLVGADRPGDDKSRATRDARAGAVSGQDTPIKPVETGVSPDVKTEEQEDPAVDTSERGGQQSISDQALVDRIKRSDRWMITLTAAIAVGGLVSAVIFYLQLAAMRGQLAEMKGQRLLTIAQSRANVARQKIHMFPVGPDGKQIVPGEGDPSGWDVNPELKNVGATEARNFQAWFYIGIIQAPRSSIQDCPSFPRPTDGKPGILPHGESTVLLAKRLTRQNAIDASTANPWKTIFVSGGGEFNDIFFPETSTHHFDWCVVILPNDIPKSVFSFPIFRESTD
jgi:hypothetical protein